MLHQRPHSKWLSRNKAANRPLWAICLSNGKHGDSACIEGLQTGEVEQRCAQVPGNQEWRNGNGPRCQSAREGTASRKKWRMLQSMLRQDQHEALVLHGRCQSQKQHDRKTSGRRHGYCRYQKQQNPQIQMLLHGHCRHQKRQNRKLSTTEKLD
jgi:hypothetical protein